TGETASVSWNQIPGAIYDLRYRKVGTTIWSTTLDIPTYIYQITGLDTFTEYEVEVRSKCFGDTPSAYSTAVNFITFGHDYCVSNSDFARDNFHISNVTINTINNNSSESKHSDFTNISTELVAGETYNISITMTSD